MGVIQNFKAYEQVKTVEGAAQTIPMGPIASQEAIKMLGTNGGGFLNANSAHPFENPTALSNLSPDADDPRDSGRPGLHVWHEWSATRGRDGRSSPLAL